MSWSEQLQRSHEVAKAESDRREISQADVVISMDTSEYGSLDLNRVDELTRLGYQSAGAKADFLLRYAVSPEDWQRYLDERNRRRIR